MILGMPKRCRRYVVFLLLCLQLTLKGIHCLRGRMEEQTLRDSARLSTVPARGSKTGLPASSGPGVSRSPEEC